MRALKEFLVTIVNCIAVIIILALLLLMMPLLFWDDGSTVARLIRKIGRKRTTPQDAEPKPLPHIQP
jgi:hypothetical protein